MPCPWSREPQQPLLPVPRAHCRLLTAQQLSLHPVSTTSPSIRCSVHPVSTAIFGPASRELRQPPDCSGAQRSEHGVCTAVLASGATNPAPYR